jgi:hypothetical protein
MPSITDLCNRLADAYELQGLPVRENLRPGVSREVVLKALAPLRVPVPEELLELYAWRNGHILEFDPEQHRYLSFRDGIFISVERIVEEYLKIQKSYGVNSTLEMDRVDLRAVIPVSSFEGAWDVVACGTHLHGSNLKYPVVHVHQGISMYFHSVESMLQTCLDWVSSPYWENLSTLPEKVEMEIWRRHNPGVFTNGD